MKTQATEPKLNDLNELNLLDHMRFLFTHRKFIIIFSALVPAVILFWGLLLKVPQFRSSAVLQLSSEDNLGSQTVSGFGLVEDKIMNNKLFALESLFQSQQFKKSLFQEVYSESGVFDGDKTLKESKMIARNYFHNSLRGSRSPESDLADILSVTREKENNTLILSTVTWSSATSQALATLAAHLLVEFNFANKTSQMRMLKDFLEKQAHNTRSELATLESQLTELQLSEKSVSLVDATTTMDREHLEVKTKQRELENQYKANDFLLVEFKKDRADYLMQLKDGKPSYLYLMQLQRKIELYRYQMQVNDAKRNVASENASQIQLDSLVQDFDREVKKNQDQLPSMSAWDYLQVLEKNISDLKIKQKTLHGEIIAGQSTLKSQRQDFVKIPEKMQRLVELKRNIDITQKLYSELQTKLQETRVRGAGQKNDLIVVVEPERPKKAEGLRLLARIFTGFLLGISTAFGLLTLTYFIIPTLRGKRDFKHLNIECLGEIPRFNQHALFSDLVKYPLIAKIHPDGAEATAFRNLRYRFCQAFDDRRSETNCKVAAFFSAEKRDGKTFTIANLAMALAGINKKVLIIDINATNSRVDKYFSSLEKIVSDSDNDLMKETPFEYFKVDPNIDLIRSIDTEENLSDFIENEIFEDVLREMKTRYNYILIDTPEVKNNFEAVAVSKYSELMVLVANHRKTLRDDVLNAAQGMEEVYAGPICAVLNCSYDEIRLRSA